MVSITDQVPSKNPADTSDLAGAFRSIFRKLMQGVDGMLPAVVVSYDRASNLAVVRPSVHLLTTEGATLPRANIASVPVLALGGGGFAVTFPLRPGDTGWIEASDRDISLYMQAQGGAQPNTLRMHSFEDGRFIPDVMRNYAIPADADPDGDMVIATIDGSQAIILKPDGITISGANIRVVATVGLAIDGPTTITGGLKVDGITFGTHRHMVDNVGVPTEGPQN